MSRLQLSKGNKANAKRGIAVIRGAIRNGMLIEPFNQKDLEKINKQFSEKGQFKHTLEFMCGRNELLCEHQKYRLNPKYNTDGIAVAERVLQKNANNAPQRQAPSTPTQKPISTQESAVTNDRNTKRRIRELDRLRGLYEETQGRKILEKSEWSKSKFLPTSSLQFMFIAAKHGWFKNLKGGRWEWVVNPMTGKPFDASGAVQGPLLTNDAPGIEQAETVAQDDVAVLKEAKRKLTEELRALTEKLDGIEAGIRKDQVAKALKAFEVLDDRGVAEFATQIPPERMQKMLDAFGKSQATSNQA